MRELDRNFGLQSLEQRPRSEWLAHYQVTKFRETLVFLAQGNDWQGPGRASFGLSSVGLASP